MALPTVTPPVETPSPARKRWPWFAAAGVGLLLGVALSAAQDGTDAVAPAPPAGASTLPTVTATGTADRAGVDTAAARPILQATSAGSGAVPDVVGMNHQQAQNTLQQAGFYLLVEADASGQGRLLVWDRNWQVVAQSVPGGSTLAWDQPITLTAKKIGE